MMSGGGKARLGANFVVNDLVIQEDICNLACEYCLTGQSLFKQGHVEQRIFDPPSLVSCEPGTELRQRLRTVLDGVARHKVPVVKISGGEVLLMRGIMDFIGELSESYETVVVLTNGIPLSKDRLQILKSLGNIVLQISLDSTRFHGNSYRVQNETTQRALMQRIYRALDSGLPTEIYTVLNDRSIEDFQTTCDDLVPYAGRTVLFPFPIRGPSRQRFLPRPDQHDAFFRVLDEAERFAGLLPSEPYRENLKRFFRESGRAFRCHLPRIALSTFDDGSVTNCPNIWFNHAGNFLEEPAEDVMENVSNSAFRRLLLAERPRIDACKACFTPWDPVSLFFEEKLTLDELAKVPIYRGRETQARLRAIRESFFEQRASHVERRHSDSE